MAHVMTWCPLDHRGSRRESPSDYSADIAKTICGWLVEGESLRTICADAWVPFGRRGLAREYREYAGRPLVERSHDDQEHQCHHASHPQHVACRPLLSHAGI